ncbi:MFS transporter permease [Streptomyces sindenensis]|uniref:MFS transporter permease n=1 Tax=Streptomyces sindenensis TaxID=67363 RepID=UPI001678C345|nr:MFS transporter permease [Streptomyces sindenensis]
MAPVTSAGVRAKPAARAVTVTGAALVAAAPRTVTVTGAALVAGALVTTAVGRAPATAPVRP